MAIKAIMAKDNIGVENGKLILQDFGSVSESVRNTKINRRFDINDLLVVIDEDKDKFYLIPINNKMLKNSYKNNNRYSTIILKQ